MNHSKKILAALVAIPATVVVAGEVQAAENTTTFEIKSSFIYGGNAIETPVQETDLVEGLKDELFNKMSTFQNASYELDVTNIPAAQREVEKVFDYLKSNLNSETSKGYDTTLLYGMINNVKVVATEVKTNNVVNKVKLDFTFNYLVEASYQKTVDAIYNVVKGETNLSGVIGVKTVHDYIINQAYVDSNQHGLIKLSTPNQGLSPHAYAMWTYLLMKKAASETGSTYDVRYVYGMSGGKLHSWNLVEIGDGKWYPLDVANDDNGTSGSQFVQYRYFLTNDAAVGNRDIYFGNNGITSTGSYNDFANIINPIKDGDKLYFVDATNGKIKSIDLRNLSINDITQNGETTEVGKMLFYKNASSIYFINTSNSNYLYESNISSPNSTKLVIKQPIASFKIEGSNLIYRAVGDTVDTKISLTNGINQGMVDYVKTYINGIVVETDPTQNYINKVVQAQKLYATLTADQKNDFDADSLAKTHLDELENSLKSSIPEVETLIEKIKALDIEKNTFLTDVKDAYNLYKDLGSTNQNLVYNSQILIDANKLITDKIALENEIYNFINAYEDPEKRKGDFYSELEGLINRYDSLHQNLKTKEFNVTYTALINLGNNTTFRSDIQEIKNKLNVLNIEAENYLELMDKIKEKYSPLTTSQKGLLTAEEIRLVEENLNKAKQMKTVITELKGYMSEIEKIDNTGTPPTALDPVLINKIKRADDLVSQGIKASQWKEILDGSVLDKETVIINIKEFLARAKLVQDGVVTLAPTAAEKINALDTVTFTTPQDYFDKVQAVEVALNDLVGNDPEKMNALLSLLNTNVVAKWDRYKLIKADIKTVVPKYITDIDALAANTSKTEADVDVLTASIESLDSIYKSLITNINKLGEMKKAFVEVKDKQVAADFILEVNYLILKENPTYDDVKKVWDKYVSLSKSSEVFKKEVEGNVSFSKLETLWGKVANDKSLVDALNLKISNANSTTTEEELKEILAQYEGLSQQLKDQVVDIDKIENYLEDITSNKANKAVEQLIKKIKELSNDSTVLEIKALREEYDALSDEHKALVPANVIKILESFEEQLESQLEKAESEAKLVIDRIKKINVNTYTETQIKNIRIAYTALSALAKTFVTDDILQILVNAENQIIYQNTVVKQAKQDASAFDTYMENITRYSTTSEIAAARALYNRLSYEAKKHVETYNKLVRLETMWKDPEYLELVYTYYPDYINAVKPGGIEIKKPEYDSLYIPDDSASNSVANSIPGEKTWSSYEEMSYQNGRYMTKITSTQVKNLSDRTLTLKAGDMEVVLPVADLKDTSGTVGVTLSVSNNQLSIQLTDGNNTKTFSEYVEVRIPMTKLNGTKDKFIERIVSGVGTPASFKVEDSNFVIRTKTSGIFRAVNSTTTYNDLGTSSAGKAIAELAKRGITYNTTTSRLVNSSKTVTREDVATLIAKALDLSSTSKTKYQDISTSLTASRAQGLLEAGIMSGATSTRFDGDSNVTNQEAAIIIANMYRYLNQDLSMAYNELKPSFTDVSRLSFEASQSIAILELFGVVDGNGNFYPNNTLTRAEFAELLYKSLKAIDFL